MSIFRNFLSKSGNNMRGSPLEGFRLVEHEDAGDDVDFLAQTPPLDIVTPSHHRIRQRPQHTERTQLSMLDVPIPRPVIEPNSHFGKMLALPIPSVRPVDINTHREASYMGINPITLMGETGLLPGSWGQGREFVNAMAWHKPRKRSGGLENASAHQNGARTGQKSNREVVNMNGLRMQYAQAVLHGDACVESSGDGRFLAFAIRRKVGTVLGERCDASADEEEWVDISDDEDGTIDRPDEAGHKREDSGYSSGEAEADSAIKMARARLLVVPRKRVRFDEVAIEQESKACKLPRLR